MKNIFIFAFDKTSQIAIFDLYTAYTDRILNELHLMGDAVKTCNLDVDHGTFEAVFNNGGRLTIQPHAIDYVHEGRAIGYLISFINIDASCKLDDEQTIAKRLWNFIQSKKPELPPDVNIMMGPV